MDLKKRRVEVVLQIMWESSLAKHVDEYFCSVNVWREGDLFPRKISDLVMYGQEGEEIEVNSSEIKSMISYEKRKVYECKNWQFKPPKSLSYLKLKKGRFYLLGFFKGLPGIFEGNPFPGRILDIDSSGNFVLDANHPLALFEVKAKAKLLKISKKDSEVGGRCKNFWEASLNGPGMQARYKNNPTDFELDNPKSFSRLDENEDTIFYHEPRLIGHIDRTCHHNLIRFYENKIPKSGKVLDLMSSFESHLPEGDYEVYGLGINMRELEANSRLHHRVVHDLNADPTLPFESDYFDVVVCDLSIEYVVRPLELLKEVKRILKPGGKIFFSFSNRYFPTKVIKVWIDLHEFERMGYVLELLARTEELDELETYSLRGYPRPVEDRWSFASNFSDPLYVVYGKKSDQ
ncbi:class I SAM-dependent methyltransferase [Thermodesulfobacterium hveragerdense]|uniref:class I SAM-dependent methyltransferase n=1 Tax=Thermodesulfobacterium hveragerdense TaxID=53424 RepID=UPI000419B972|nr:class I SAM-dependent methyltransferase [Thermodesulfobacterium hveragerdense]